MTTTAPATPTSCTDSRTADSTADAAPTAVPVWGSSIGADKGGKVDRMHSPTLEELITSAQALLRPHRVGDRLLGDVAATLVTDAGRRYGGVCIDTGSGTGFCAEQSAIAAMVTAGEYRISAIVAVWRDEQGDLYVLPRAGAAASSSARSTRATSTPSSCSAASAALSCATYCPPTSGRSLSRARSSRPSRRTACGDDSPGHGAIRLRAGSSQRDRHAVIRSATCIAALFRQRARRSPR